MKPPALVWAAFRSCAVALVPLLALVAPANAKNCGGAVACVCGDRVTAPAVLTRDLSGCRTFGLEIASGGSLDCAGRQVGGPGDRTEWAGIRVLGVHQSTVKNCRVRNFERGIYLDGGTSNLITNNVVFGNRIGIHLGSGAVGNDVSGNEVRDNQDEGLHLGAGTSGNRIAGNLLSNNAVENLYLLSTFGNQIIDNVSDRARETAILVKHSSSNYFARNVVGERTINVRGESSDNVFEENELLSGGFSFNAFQDDRGWTWPKRNQVQGGLVLKASTCFRFYGSSDNHAVDVGVDNCRVMQEQEEGPIPAAGNSATSYSVGEDPDDLDCIDCSDSGSNTASIRRARTERGDDRLTVLWAFTPGAPIEPLLEEIAISLSDPDGTALSLVLPAGTLRATATGYRFEERSGASFGGLRMIDLKPQGAGWVLRLTVRTNLSAAEGPALVVGWRVGDNSFAVSETWTATARGWRLRQSR